MDSTGSFGCVPVAKPTGTPLRKTALERWFIGSFLPKTIGADWDHELRFMESLVCLKPGSVEPVSLYSRRSIRILRGHAPLALESRNMAQPHHTYGSRDRPRSGQHHLHFHPLGQTAARAAGQGAEHRADAG